MNTDNLRTFLQGDGIWKGQDILKAVGWFLRLFGIESGL